MNYVVDKVKGGVKRGCVHFDTPSFLFLQTYYSLTIGYIQKRITISSKRLTVSSKKVDLFGQKGLPFL